MATLRIIGVGNEHRGDDGVGIDVARRLWALAPPGVEVAEATGEGVALMDAWEGAGAVIVVDAVRSGAAPGTLFRFDAHADLLPTSFFHYSTHAFGVAEAVEVARLLGLLPPHLLLYGIEGRCYDPGAGLSPEVAHAADALVARLRDESFALSPLLPPPLSELPPCTSSP